MQLEKKGNLKEDKASNSGVLLLDHLQGICRKALSYRRQCFTKIAPIHMYEGVPGESYRLTQNAPESEMVV